MEWIRLNAVCSLHCRDKITIFESDYLPLKDQALHSLTFYKVASTILPFALLEIEYVDKTVIRLNPLL